MKKIGNFGGAGVKDGQYGYLNIFVDLLDRLISIIIKLFDAVKGKKEYETDASTESTTAAPAEEG